MEFDPIQSAPEMVAEPEQVKAKTVRKPKAKPAFILPVPTQIDGGKNSTIEDSVQKRFAKIAFYKGTKPGTKPHAIIWDTATPKAAKDPGTMMSRFIYSLIEAVTTGTSMSGDGAAIYADENFKKVLVEAPEFGNYVLELTPAGKSGLQLYRSTVNEWMQFASRRASIIRTSKKVAGTKARTTRQVVATSTKSKVEVTF